MHEPINIESIVGRVTNRVTEIVSQVSDSLRRNRSAAISEPPYLPDPWSDNKNDELHYDTDTLVLQLRADVDALIRLGTESRTILLDSRRNFLEWRL